MAVCGNGGNGRIPYFQLNCTWFILESGDVLWPWDNFLGYINSHRCNVHGWVCPVLRWCFLVPPILEVGICWHWINWIHLLTCMAALVLRTSTSILWQYVTMMSSTDSNHRARWHWRLLSGRCACHLRMRIFSPGHSKWPFEFDPVVWAHLEVVTEQPLKMIQDRHWELPVDPVVLLLCGDDGFNRQSVR